MAYGGLGYRYGVYRHRDFRGAAQYAFGLFIGPLADTFGWSRTALSASVSFAALGGLTAPLLGRALDVYGARPFYWVLYGSWALVLYFAHL